MLDVAFFISSMQVITLSFVITYLAIIITMKYFKSIYFLNQTNNINSLHAKPLLRGFGVLYLLPIVAVQLLNENILSVNEIMLLCLSTFLGYLDDKKGLSQKIKLIALILIFLLIFLSYNTLDISNFSFFIMNVLFFLFFILFFNQIDGINGLSASTFLVYLTSIFILSSFNIMSIPLFLTVGVSILVYLNFNMRHKTILQGDAGSYYLGAFAYIISARHNEETFMLWSTIIIVPLLLDVFWTTISRFYYGKKILLGHRDNIYQQLSIYLRSHAKVTCIFISFQIIISGTFIYLKGKYHDVYLIIFVFFILLIISFVWLVLYKKFNIKNQ